MELRSPFLLLKVVYDDDDLIEFEARLVAGDWSGRSHAYASAAGAAEDADSLAKWVLRPESPFVLKYGNESNGFGRLQFRTVDKAGHIACYVQLGDMGVEADRGRELLRGSNARRFWARRTICGRSESCRDCQAGRGHASGARFQETRSSQYLMHFSLDLAEFPGKLLGRGLGVGIPALSEPSAVMSSSGSSEMHL